MLRSYLNLAIATTGALLLLTATVPAQTISCDAAVQAGK